MVWIILALCALTALLAFVVKEIRTASEVDDSYEVQLRDHYRAKAAEARRAPAKEGPSRSTNAA